MAADPPSTIFLPAIAVAEMAQGIGKLRRAGGVERADRLDSWLDGLLAAYADRILPLDAAAARLTLVNLVGGEANAGHGFAVAQDFEDFNLTHGDGGGLAFCLGSFASSKISVKRPVKPEIDPSQIDGPTR